MSFFIFLFSTLLSAATRPDFPAPEVDKTLTQNLSAREFFSQRSSNATCVSELEAERSRYRVQRKELQTLKASGASAAAIDAKEKESINTLDEVMKHVEVCGECATQKIVKKGGWTIADGSCQLPLEDKAQLESIFQKSVEDLLNIQKYAAYRDGFASLWEFVAMDYNTGELLPNVGKIPSPSNLYTYIAVKGLGSMGFQYIGKNDIQTREKNGLKELIITVAGVPFPDGFEPPAVYSIKASGEKSKTNLKKPLTDVQAMWYLNSDGYSRYYTAADFGLLGSLPFLGNVAKETLSNTLFRQVERSLGEP